MSSRGISKADRNRYKRLVRAARLASKKSGDPLDRQALAMIQFLNGPKTQAEETAGRLEFMLDEVKGRPALQAYRRGAKRLSEMERRPVDRLRDALKRGK